MIKAFDTHLHLDAFDDPERVLNEARAAGIDNWVVPGVSPDGWARIEALAEGYPGVYSAPGIHPLSADRFQPETAAELRNLLAHPRAVAVGEVGLDRQVDVPWPVQEQVFAAMIRLAREMDKPMLVHARESIDRLLKIMQREGADQVGGVFHAFSGSVETAQRIIDAGFLLGIGGVVTWPGARRLPEVVRAFDGLVRKLGPAVETQWAALSRSIYYAEAYADRTDIRLGPRALASVDLLDILAWGHHGGACSLLRQHRVISALRPA
mgnify:CR=1 FL=1